MKCCDLVYWKHNDGWDIYKKQDCYYINNHWVPMWFDTFIAEDLPTKNQALQFVKQSHVLGICLI